MSILFESGRKIDTRPKRIPEAIRQCAVRSVLDHLDEFSNITTAWQSAAGRLCFDAESWVRQAKFNCGQLEGVTTVEAEDVGRVWKENGEVRDANITS